MWSNDEIPSSPHATASPSRQRAQLGQRLDDEGEAVGQVIAGPTVEPHAFALLTGDDAEAVVIACP